MADIWFAISCVLSVKDILNLQSVSVVDSAKASVALAK
jgi:hypothetical protein